MNDQVADRARDFLDKASKWLGWCDESYSEMLRHATDGNIDQVEKHFVNLLLLLDGVHQSLLDAAKKLGQIQWRERLDQLRSDDPLLRYMWNARRSEAHDALIKWRPSMKHLEMQIVLAETARIIQFGAPTQHIAVQRLFHKAFGVETNEQFFEKIKSGYFPSHAEQLSAGIHITLSLDSLSLDSFKIGGGNREVIVAAPEQHLGQVLPPSATEAARLAIAFYRNEREELGSLRHEA